MGHYASEMPDKKEQDAWRKADRKRDAKALRRLVRRLLDRRKKR